jgi:hypothetical protein
VVQGGVALPAAAYAYRRHEPGTCEVRETYVSCPQQEQARARHPYVPPIAVAADGEAALRAGSRRFRRYYRGKRAVNRGPSVAVRETADGAHRPWRGLNPVRHASVDTATQRSTARQGDTRRDREERPASHENPQLAGRFRSVWQVMGSNHRRLSRRFYRPLSLRTSQSTPDQRIFVGQM